MKRFSPCLMDAKSRLREHASAPPLPRLLGCQQGMRRYYCWRCEQKMPFLEEDEWETISPLLADAARAITSYRTEHDCDLATARRNCKPEAMIKLEEITGMPGIHFDTIYHHRLSDWGIECHECGELLRTPRANYCANCGATDAKAT